MVRARLTKTKERCVPTLMHYKRLTPLIVCSALGLSAIGAVMSYTTFNGDPSSPQPSVSSISVPATSTPTPTPSPTSTSLPTVHRDGDFTLVKKQDFSKDAQVGSFEQVYGKKLTGYNGFLDHDNRGSGYYDADRVLSVNDGILNYHLHTAGGKPLVAAVTPTGYNGQKYGKYVVRFRADLAPGYRAAFLLWPDSNQWHDGELDFPEVDLTPMTTAEKPGSINGFAHDVLGNPKLNHLRFITREDAQQWHTATIEWTPEKVSFTLDGRTESTTDPAAIPTVPMHWVLQTQTSSPKQVAPDADVSGNVQVDWFAQYAYTPEN